MSAPSIADPGSFRDPSSRVVTSPQGVFRVLNEEGNRGWQALADSELLARWTGSGRLIETTPVERASWPAGLTNPEWVACVEHARVPFVSYPYEWTFSMLRDAASLTLDLMLDALSENLILKDATPYNVQWRGPRPVFIDVGSFEPYQQGTPWVGYGQFCELFLYPLMLRAYRDIAFQPWLRGSLEGVTSAQALAMFGPRNLLKPGVAMHVALRARLERRHADSDVDARSEMSSAGFNKGLIEVNVRRLRKLVTGLRWAVDSSTWSGYAADCAHVEADRGPKSEFVTRVLESRRLGLVWDLGANDGHFSRLAADHADSVVAMDGDELVTDRLFRSLRRDRVDNVLALMVDLANPSPGQGWRGAERATLEHRGKPDLVLCLAVLHHLTIGRNIPVAAVVDWLASLGGQVVLEFARPDDPMVKKLTRNKSEHDVHRDYDEKALRALVAEHFTVVAEAELPSGHRFMMHLTPTS